MRKSIIIDRHFDLGVIKMEFDVKKSLHSVFLTATTTAMLFFDSNIQRNI